MQYENCSFAADVLYLLRRPTLHLGNDPPAGNHAQDSGASRTPFASTSAGACGLTGTSSRLRIIVVLTTIENSCAHLSSPPLPAHVPRCADTHPHSLISLMLPSISRSTFQPRTRGLPAR